MAYLRVISSVTKACARSVSFGMQRVHTIYESCLRIVAKSCLSHSVSSMSVIRPISAEIQHFYLTSQRYHDQTMKSSSSTLRLVSV